MLEDRFNKVFAIFGQRGSGKTEFLKGNAELKIPGIINIYPQRTPAMKVLIIDTFDHPSYQNIPILKPKDLQYWQKGIYRCFTNAEDIPKLNRFLRDSPAIWNTLLVYEDAYKHTSKYIDKSLINLMADSKQKNIDICFMYHSFKQAPPDLYRYVDFIELFKTKDTPECRKDYMDVYYNKATEIFNEVKNNKSPFFHKTIDTEQNG